MNNSTHKRGDIVLGFGSDDHYQRGVFTTDGKAINLHHDAEIGKCGEIYKISACSLGLWDGGKS